MRLGMENKHGIQQTLLEKNRVNETNVKVK